MKKNYKVTGMSCAACSARVQKAVSNVNGVAECNVNLLTGDMTVDGQFDGSSVIAAVKKAGYGVHLQGNVATDETDVFDVEVKKLKTRFISSLVFLIMLMYVSMGMMLGFPLPSLLSKNHAVNGLTQLLLSGIILVINQRFFISGVKSALHGSKRPVFEEILARQKTKDKVDVIMVYTLNRLTRNHPDFYFIRELVDKYNTKAMRSIFSIF